MVNLLHGDCLELMKEIPDNSIDLLCTSPPYYNAKEYSHWDTYEDYLEWIQIVFENVYHKLKPGRMCVVNLSVIIIPRKNRQSESSRLPIPFHFVNIMEKIGYKFLEDIIWVKPDGASKNRNGRFSIDRQPMQYKPNVVNEYILVFQKKCDVLIDKVLKEYPREDIQMSLITEEYERTNIWKMNPATISKHPAPFPIELSNKVVSYYSMVNGTVLDPFMGSGTTGVSCVNLNRDFIGIELDDEYFELAKNRIEEREKEIKNRLW